MESKLFGNIDAVEDVFADGGLTQLAVKDAGDELFLLSSNVQGDVFYVGVPSAEDETGAGTHYNTGLLANPGQDKDGPRWPLLLLGHDGAEAADQ